MVAARRVVVSPAESRSFFRRLGLLKPFCKFGVRALDIWA